MEVVSGFSLSMLRYGCGSRDWRRTVVSMIALRDKGLNYRLLTYGVHSQAPSRLDLWCRPQAVVPNVNILPGPSSTDASSTVPEPATGHAEPLPWPEHLAWQIASLADRGRRGAADARARALSTQQSRTPLNLNPTPIPTTILMLLTSSSSCIHIKWSASRCTRIKMLAAMHSREYDAALTHISCTCRC
jgi:hypothetical protein